MQNADTQDYAKHSNTRNDIVDLEWLEHLKLHLVMPPTTGGNVTPRLCLSMFACQPMPQFD